MLNSQQNENTTCQNLRDQEKDGLKWNIYRKKNFQINHLKLYLKELQGKQTKPKVSRRKEIIRTRAERSKIKNKKAIEKNETKSWFILKNQQNW